MQGGIRTIVDLSRIRANVGRIAQEAGVDVIAAIKADAYGHGAVRVGEAIGDLVSGFYVFRPRESIDARLFESTGKPTIAAVVELDADLDLLRAHAIRPGVWTIEQIDRFASLDPLLSVDTGMQRFACPPEQLQAMFDRYAFGEAFTHASRAVEAERLMELTAGRALRRHAGGSALLADGRSRFDAVRPGLALYEGATRVVTRLVDARHGRGPAGYSGFSAPRHGVILAGYSNGLRNGPCMVNGRRQALLEVGMQSAYVSLDPADRTGDEVVLLGDGVTLDDVATAWRASPHNALFTLAAMGEKTYV